MHNMTRCAWIIIFLSD